MTALRVYVAGPLFDLKQLDGNQRFADAIEHHSEGRYKPILPQLLGASRDPIAIRNSCLRALIASDVAVFQLDGSEPDSGTVVEFMLARMLDMPSVLIRTDFRVGGDQAEAGEPWNLMLSGWPRTASVVRHAMTLWGEGQDAWGRLADDVIDAFEGVLRETSAIPPADQDAVMARALVSCGMSLLKGAPEGFTVDRLVQTRRTKGLWLTP